MYSLVSDNNDNHCVMQASKIYENTKKKRPDYSGKRT